MIDGPIAVVIVWCAKFEPDINMTGDHVGGVGRNFHPAGRDVELALKAVGCENEEALAQFLSAIVRNRLLDALRYHEAGRRDVRRKVEEPTMGMGAVAPAVGDPTPSLAASVGEQLRVYREVLLTLPERQRMLLRLRLENEMPFAEIAEQLGHASADAARKAFRDAQARMLVKLRARGIKPPGEATAW